MTDRPTAQRVMAEWGVDIPVWGNGPDSFGPVAVEVVDISDELIAQLREWNQRFNHLHETDYGWPDKQREQSWRADGPEPGYRLQNELPDVEISYVEDGDNRPLRRRRGP